MKSLKVAAVTVLYYPDQEVIRKIGSYISFVEKLYVIDNSEIVDRAFSCLLEGTYEEKIRLIANHQNRGIAYALDQGIEKAYNAGFSWVLMMDQDSEFRPGTPEILFNALRKYDNSDKVGIFSGNIELIGGKNSIVDKGLTNLKTALTSGSILNLAAYYDTGPFSERFFIDQVDHEYCLRLRRRRYEILRCDAALIMHSLGDTCIHRFLGRKINVSNHNYVRRYYMTRNRLEVCRMYFFSFPYHSISLMWFLVVDLFLVVLYEKDKRRKLISIFQGTRDFLFRRFGKYVYS